MCRINKGIEFEFEPGLAKQKSSSSCNSGWIQGVREGSKRSHIRIRKESPRSIICICIKVRLFPLSWSSLTSPSYCNDSLSPFDGDNSKNVENG